MLVRGLCLFALVAVLGVFTHSITSNPGDVVIVWQGYDVRFSTTVLFAFLAIALVGFFLSGYIFSWLSLFPKLVRARRGRKYESKGLGYLFEAFEALSLGDAKDAERAAHKSAKLLSDTRLSRVVEAQALSHQGKVQKAEALYLELSSEKKSQLAGLRGLLAQSIKEESWHEAELLLESCQEEYPKNGWVVKNAMLVYLHQGHFYKAQDYLKTYLSYADVSEEEKQNTQRGLALLKTENAHKAVDVVHKKYGLTLPTALFQINHYVEQEKWRAAYSLVSEMYKAMPNLVVYRLWCALLERRYRKADVLKHTLMLVKDKPETAASKMAVAQAQLLTGNALKARQILVDLLETYPYRDVYDLLVEAERALNPHSKDIQVWTEKALNAQNAPQPYMESSYALYAWLDRFAAPLDMELFSLTTLLDMLSAHEDDGPLAQEVVASTW